VAHRERERHNAADQERAMCSGPTRPLALCGCMMGNPGLMDGAELQ
jgi:hypothetical protein